MLQTLPYGNELTDVFEVTFVIEKHVYIYAAAYLF